MAISESDEPSEANMGFRFSVWCIKAIGLIIISAIGATYGIGAYKLFSALFSNDTHGRSGVMLVSFLAGIPICLGMLVGYLAKRRRLFGIANASALSTLSIALFIFAAGAVFREGIICIVMAAPIFFALGIAGAILGVLLSALGSSRGPRLLSVALLLPIFIAPVENDLVSSDTHLITVRSTFIAANPESVWNHINFPLDIKPYELRNGFAYRIGVPYPIEARTIEGRVGGKRLLHWERGVTFEEIITDWQPNRYIAWRYKFQPNSFPPGSLDDHIVIGGRYFNLDTTAYTLTPENGGTRLSIMVGTSVTTNFNWYASLWARFLIGNTAEEILQFYKTRSEPSSSLTNAT